MNRNDRILLFTIGIMRFGFRPDPVIGAVDNLGIDNLDCTVIETDNPVIAFSKISVISGGTVWMSFSVHLPAIVSSYLYGAVLTSAPANNTAAAAPAINAFNIFIYL